MGKILAYVLGSRFGSESDGSMWGELKLLTKGNNTSFISVSYETAREIHPSCWVEIEIKKVSQNENQA